VAPVTGDGVSEVRVDAGDVFAVHDDADEMARRVRAAL